MQFKVLTFWEIDAELDVSSATIRVAAESQLCYPITTIIVHPINEL